MKRSRATPAALPFTPIRLTEQAAMPPTLPRFVVTPGIGRLQLEDISTDLMLVTMLSSQHVPSCLHAREETVGEQIKRSIESSRFDGRQGQKLVVETTLPGITPEFPRRLLIAGIGSPQTFCAGVAHSVFRTLIDEAVALGVKKITVPFVANRGTGNCTNLKAMSYQLKLALAKSFASLDGQPALEEIQILCSPQARRYIELGLAIPINDDDDTDSSDEDCHCS